MSYGLNVFEHELEFHGWLAFILEFLLELKIHRHIKDSQILPSLL